MLRTACPPVACPHCVIRRTSERNMEIDVGHRERNTNKWIALWLKKVKKLQKWFHFLDYWLIALDFCECSCKYNLLQFI